MVGDGRGSIFNINAFRNETWARGIHRSNKWLVQIPMAAMFNSQLSKYEGQLDIQYQPIATRMQLWCEAGPIPGTGLHSRPLMPYGYGPTEKKPTHTLFEDVTVSFINDGEGYNWTYLQQWMNNIVNYDSSRGIKSFDITDPYEVNYKQDYAVDIVFSAFNDAGDNTISICLREAYPIFMAPLPMNWGDSNIQRVAVTFTYIDWYNIGIKKFTP